MMIDRFLTRNGVVGFAVFSLFVVWAFWPSKADFYEFAAMLEQRLPVEQS